ncbi:hypothetical protein GCM10010358_76750 [Streptomyces minutiscleroticus]|uniref:AbiTii domain-containing protein n=1 Tax=Streptomyces minutiscleroticus TaxID=68238 RepID=A0A918P1V8_9ACTN|nr:hypothetical protein [Streptomyces minutiscleroticus]GGY13135.1 hypothetical protein GCM10010358_76750 [Streptomyces minutiscleroticus]
MAKNSPLDQLELDILDESVTTQKLLKLVVVIGGRAFSEPLRQWALNELRGYEGPIEEIPSYRIVVAPIQGDSRSSYWIGRGETISALELPDFAQDLISEQLPIRFGVAKIQNLIDTADDKRKVKVSLPGGAELARTMTYERREQGVIVESLYWAVHVSALQDILEQVRNRLLEFIAELRATATPGTVDPTVEQVHTAVQNIHITVGDNSPVNLNAPITPEKKSARVRIPSISRRSRFFGA